MTVKLSQLTERQFIQQAMAEKRTVLTLKKDQLEFFEDLKFYFHDEKNNSRNVLLHFFARSRRGKIFIGDSRALEN